MFNKQEYWNRRRAGERGQENPSIKPYPKGAKVPYTNREGDIADYPNAEGKILVRDAKGYVALNRKEARRRSTDRDYTKPNYAYRTHRERVPFTGHKRNLEKNPQLKLPKYPANQTNHQRILARSQERAS